MGTGSLLYRQQISVICAKIPSQPGAPLMNYDFRIEPPENVENTTFNNDVGGRYNIATGSSEEIGFGTVGTASVLIIQPDTNIQIQLTNQFTITGTITSSSAAVTSVSSLDGLSVGDSVSGAGIPADTTIIAISTSGFTLSNPATAGASGAPLTIVGIGKPMLINGGQSSVMNVNFTGLTLINPLSSGAATGRFFLVGV